MTEKRFALAYETNDQNCIWWAVRDGDITLWKEEVVGLLNELDEKNNELKEFIRNLTNYKGEILLSNGRAYKREYVERLLE